MVAAHCSLATPRVGSATMEGKSALLLRSTQRQGARVYRQWVSHPFMKPRPRPIPGVVYVLESLKHIGVCKIGRSTRGGVIRAAELEKIRGYRGFAPWRSAAEFHTTDCVVLEMAVHKRLKRRRVRLDYVTCRELFRISAGRGDQPYPRTEPQHHPFAAKFPDPAWAAKRGGVRHRAHPARHDWRLTLEGGHAR